MTAGVSSNVTAGKDSRLSETLERGVTVLECFTPERSRLGIKEISELVAISTATVHRYVSTFVQLGWLEQAPGPGHKYRLGQGPTDIGHNAVKARAAYRHARPRLEELRREVSYTVSLAERDGRGIIFLDRLRGFRGHAGLGLDLGMGSRLPIYCTSMGKVLLADLPLGQREMEVNTLTLDRLTPNTITDMDLLIEELELARVAGVAFSNGELREGVRAVAAPVRDRSGIAVAAVNIAAPASMVSDSHMTDELVPHLLATTAQISGALGYQVDGPRREESAERP